MSTSQAIDLACHESIWLAPRASAVTVGRSLIVGLLASVIFLPEFARDGTSNAGMTAYTKVLGGFRYVDVGILVLLVFHLAALGCRRAAVTRVPRSLRTPGIAFLACIAAAMYYGKVHGGHNLFFDWRGLALGLILYVVWSCWLRGWPNVRSALLVFATYVAIRIALLYALFLAGYSENLLGVAIPIFDGPVLSCIVFAGLLAFSYQESEIRPRRKLLWRCLAASAYLIVVICFRRTYWGELAIGTSILLLLQKRNLVRNILLLAGMLAAAVMILGAPFSSRMQSFDLTQDNTQFSADNSDHLFDLVDAWSQVRQSPVTGIGLGTSYSTWHIKRWKTESVMVHNAPLHVWLKYGLAGLCCYLWFHVVLLRWLYRTSRTAAGEPRSFLTAAFAYITAQFVVTLGFAPWPYSELQLTTLLSFIVAAAVAANKPAPLRFPYEYSLPVGNHALLQQR